MSKREREHATILAIQQQVDYYSCLWVTTHSIHAYAQYTYYIRELIAIKQAILAHECIYGWNN